jgi:hypothetical protein
MLGYLVRFWHYEEMTDEEAMTESREVDRQDARAAAARFGRGNIPLQLDSLVTSEDLECERKELRSITLPSLR